MESPLIKEYQDAYKSKDSNEVVKNEMGLRDFNDSSKEGVKSKENEHVGLGDFDELYEEIVDGSSGIEKDRDCVMDLDDDGKETESNVSAMGDENTIGEQDGNDYEYEGGDAATHGIDLYRFSKCIHDGDDLLNQQKITCVVSERSRFRRKKKGRTHVEGYMHQIESMMLVLGSVWVSASSTTIRVFLRCEIDGFLVHTHMEFLDRKMVKNGYKMAICGMNKLDDGVNGSFAIMGVFPKCNFEGLLVAKQVILLDRKMAGNDDKRMVYGLNKWGKGGTRKKGQKDTSNTCIQEWEAQNETGNVKYEKGMIKMKLDFMSFQKGVWQKMGIGFVVVVDFVVCFGKFVEMQEKLVVEIEEKLVARESSELG
ncbi:hypothetical protein Tco_1375684 [Tanacetum coccineum]